MSIEETGKRRRWCCSKIERLLYGKRQQVLQTKAGVCERCLKKWGREGAGVVVPGRPEMRAGRMPNVGGRVAHKGWRAVNQARSEGGNRHKNIRAVGRRCGTVPRAGMRGSSVAARGKGVPAVSDGVASWLNDAQTDPLPGR